MPSKSIQATTTVCGRVQIRVLGEFSVLAPDGTTIMDERHGRKAAVLKYLVCHKGARCNPKLLGEILWPESTPQAAMSNVRVALHHIRRIAKAHGLPNLLLSDGPISLDTSLVGVDVWTLELRAAALLAQENADAAALLDCLLKLDAEVLPGDEYADWCSEYRSFLESLKRRIMLRLLRAWGRGELSFAQSRTVERVAYKFALEQPGDPEITPALIDVLVMNKRCVEAVDLRRRFVAEDGDVSQLPVIRSAEWITQPSKPLRVLPHVSWKARAEFAISDGSREVAALGDALDLCFDGVGQCLVIHGEQESVRTSIVEEILEEADDRGALVCDILIEGDLISTLLMSFDRLCASVDFDAERYPEIAAHIDRLRDLQSQYELGSSDFNLKSAIVFEFSAVLRALARNVNVVVSVDNVDVLDELGAGFLSQLMLLARWSGMFVVLRVDLTRSLHTPVGEVLDSLRGTVPFLAIRDRRLPTPINAAITPSVESLRKMGNAIALHGITKQTTARVAC
jgi:DNA-binding SARP family transcriptional activator